MAKPRHQLRTQMEGELSAKAGREDHAVMMRNEILRPRGLVAILVAAEEQLRNISSRAFFQNAVEKEIVRERRAATLHYVQSSWDKNNRQWSR